MAHWFAHVLARLFMRPVPFCDTCALRYINRVKTKLEERTAARR